jgi:tetratricopeptide (TPR) repeat protein
MAFVFRISRFAAAVALVALFACSTSAHAEENVAKAKQLYDDAVTEYNLGHYRDALRSFESGYRLKHDASFLFNIAQCQRQVFEYENARRSFQAYLRESPKLPDARREQVEKLISQMEQAIDEQRNRQPPTGTEPVAGTVAATPPVAHEPVVAPTVSPPPPARNDRSGSKLRLAGIAVGSFGAAAVVAGGAFYAVAKSANDTLNRPSDGTFSESAQSKRNTFQTLDIVAFIVGGAAIVTGVAVYVAGRRRDRRPSLRANGGAQRATSFGFEF